MKHIRSIITLGCLAAMAATAGAQGFRAGGGITDIMRAGPRLGPPAARPSTAPAAVPTQRAAEFIVALVNSEPITNTDVLKRVDRLVKENPDAARVPRNELTRLVLDRLITERAQLQLAKENGIKVDDVAVDQAEQTVARQNEISLTELRRRVAAEGISQPEFRSDLRDQLLLTRLRDREVEAKVKVSDSEVDEYLVDQRNVSVKNAALQNLNLAQVLVALPETATDAQIATAQQKAQSIAQRARAGEDFAKLVRENSDSPDRENGGAIGMRTADRYPPLFVDAVQSIAVNGIAGPVRSSAGFHVLKVLAKSQLGSADATVTQTQVRHILLRQRSASSPGASRRATGGIQAPPAGGHGRFRAAWRATTRRTPAPSKAATSAGRAPASSCPSSRRRWTALPPGQISRSGGVALRRAPDPGAGAAPRRHARASASSAKPRATVLREKKLRGGLLRMGAGRARPRLRRVPRTAAMT